jgi:hypothetical protein
LLDRKNCAAFGSAGSTLTDSTWPAHLQFSVTPLEIERLFPPLWDAESGPFESTSGLSTFAWQRPMCGGRSVGWSMAVALPIPASATAERIAQVRIFTP